MKKSILIFILLFSTACFSQEKENFTKEDTSINPLLKGSLYSPLKQNKTKKQRLSFLLRDQGQQTEAETKKD